MQFPNFLNFLFIRKNLLHIATEAGEATAVLDHMANFRVACSGHNGYSNLTTPHLCETNATTHTLKYKALTSRILPLPQLLTGCNERKFAAESLSEFV